MKFEADIDRQTQDWWLLGGSVPGVLFRMNERVRVISGPNAGAIGELISIYALQPEPLFHLETSDGADAYVRQSEIAPANKDPRRSKLDA
jgi:hypothetical protein